jgi:hypothetical protein
MDDLAHSCVGFLESAQTLTEDNSAAREDICARLARMLPCEKIML